MNPALNQAGFSIYTRVSWSPYSTRPCRGNGLRLCCGREPILRVDMLRERAGRPLVHFECRFCQKAGDPTLRDFDAFRDAQDDAQDEDEVKARVEWQMCPG